MAALSAAATRVLSGSAAASFGTSSRNAKLPASAFARASLSSEFSGIQLARAPVAAARKSAARKAAPATCKVSVGDVAPEVSLVDQDGRSFSLSKLRGRKNVVLFFYPADDTPGCTKEVCSFRDSFEEFLDLGAEVVGVSGDSPESHKAFADKYDLPFRLLSDEGNEVRAEFGIPADLFGFLPGRQTYVIDKKGVVQLVFNNQFQPEKHIAQTTVILEELKAEEPEPGFKLPGFNFPDIKLPELKIPKF